MYRGLVVFNLTRWLNFYLDGIILRFLLSYVNKENAFIDKNAIILMIFLVKILRVPFMSLSAML